MTDTWSQRHGALPVIRLTFDRFLDKKCPAGGSRGHGFGGFGSIFRFHWESHWELTGNHQIEAQEPEKIAHPVKICFHSPEKSTARIATRKLKLRRENIFFASVRLGQFFVQIG